jgi:hypothetical protein
MLSITSMFPNNFTRVNDFTLPRQKCNATVQYLEHCLYAGTKQFLPTLTDFSSTHRVNNLAPT